MTTRDDENRIEEIMKELGVPRDEAEFLLSIEKGEIESDVITDTDAG